MSMTKQNFEALAEMCADETHEELLCEATIDLLAAFCRSQNNKFDTDRFSFVYTNELSYTIPGLFYIIIVFCKII